MSLSSTESLQQATNLPQNVIADKEGAAYRPSRTDVKVSGIHQASIENKLISSSAISRKTVNGQQPLVKKRARISQEYELNKETLEKSYELEVAIIRLHLTGFVQMDRLEKLKREHADKLKELELAHPTANNPIQHETGSFTENVDGHSFEGNAHHGNSFDAIDNVCGQSTDANGKRCVHKVENRGTEVSKTKAVVTHTSASKSSRNVASSLLEDKNETANSRSTSRSAKGASDAVVELGGGATSARINQGDVLPGNSLLEKIDLGKEMLGGAEKDTFHHESPLISSGEGAEDMTSHDVLTSGASAIKVFSDNAREAGVDKEIPSSETAPQEEVGGFPSIEAPQSSEFRKTSVDDCDVLEFHSMAVCSTEDQIRDGSEVLVSPKPTRATAGNVSPSHCQEGMVSENLTSDAIEDGQIRDVHREVTCRSEFFSSSAVVPDERGQDLEILNNLQEVEAEEPNSRNCVSSQIHPVVQSQVYDVFPSTGHIPLADGIEIQLHQDALISPRVETGTHWAPNSRAVAAQTSSQPAANAAAHSLGTSGGHIGSSPLPSFTPPQPLVQGAVERPSPDPLDIELEKLKRAGELTVQTYADLNLRLKSERDREIQDIVAQIHAKYDLAQKESDAAYKLKENDLGSYTDRVYLHKKLVEVFGIYASGLHLQQGGVPGNAPQRSFDGSSSARGPQNPSLGASSTSLPPNTSPALHANRTSSHYSSFASRPLLTSTTPARNMLAPISTAPSMASRTVAPHLRHFRPQAGQILQESYLARNLTNQLMSLAGNVSSYPTSQILNQVLPPPEAVRPQVRNSIPGPSGSADFVSLSDDD